MIDTLTTRRLPHNRLSRRALVGGAAGAAAATALGAPRIRARQGTPAALPEFTREASIVSWGFGALETNPVAFTRIEAFKQAYPNIQIELVPELEDQKLLTAAVSGEVPDVLWIGRNSIGTWAGREVLIPLDDMIADSTIDLSQYYEAAVEESKFNDAMYGVPQFMDVRVLYVNNDHLTEAGVDPATLDTGNWEQLSEVGGQLVVRDGDTVERWGFDHKIQAGHLWLWGFANDASFMSDDAQTVTFNDPKAVEALDWGLQAYEAQGGFQSYESFASTWQGDEQFARGLVAITEYENWMLGITGAVAPDLNFTVMPIVHRGGGDNVSYTGGNAWAIPEGAPDPEAAWVFIQFMSSVDTWRIAAEQTKAFRQENNQLYIPSLTANRVADQMQIDEFYEPIAQPFDDAVRLFPHVLETSRNLVVSASPVGKPLSDMLMSASQKALRGEQSPQEALDEVTEQGQEEIDDFEG